jgi:hypothetical protein
LGPSGPTPEEIEREAAAELRKALAGSGPRNGPAGMIAPIRGTGGDPTPGAGVAERADGLTPDDERRAITDFAVQQLTDRPFGSIRPADTIPAPASGLTPEDMRNRALADALEKQRRMAHDRPAAAPPANRVAPASGQRTSGVTISPRLTVSPTLTGSRPPLLGDTLGRGSGPVPAEFLSPPAAPRGPGRLPTNPGRQSASSPRRAAPRSAEAEGRWQALAELADLLGEEAFPADALPDISRWLATTVGSMAAVLLLADGAVDVVAAWPERDSVARDLTASLGRPVDHRSPLWEVVATGRPVPGGPDQPIVMPDGTPCHDLGAWVIVPIVDRTVVFGAVLVAQDRGEPFPSELETLVADVGQRIGRALRNCEEVASSAGAGDGGLPPAVRDGLGALSVVLGAVEGMPAPALAADQNREYRLIAGQAAELRSLIAGFLAGQLGGGQ